MRRLQEKLQELGYYAGEIDGNFDAYTVHMYERMCEDYGIEPERDENGDVIVSEERFAVINALVILTPTPAPTATFAPAPVLSMLIMATNAQFPPYEFYGDDGKVVGLDAEIGAAIAEYMGYDFLWINDMDFGDIIDAVESGRADFGLAGMTVTEDRLKRVAFSNTYATNVQVIIVRKGSDITSVDDLFADGANYIIGVQKSTTGDLYATEDIAEGGLGSVSRFDSGIAAIQALKEGKVDCVIIDNEPAKAYVAANEGLIILDTEYSVEDYVACFAKDNTKLLDQFNAALEALTKDGTIPAIIEKYIPSNGGEGAGK